MTGTTGSLEAGDKAAAEVQKTPNRVTLKELRAKIGSTRFYVDGVLTICVATCLNGYKLVGKSAPVDPANFNEELGREFALEDAERQLWPILGYDLCTKVSAL